VEMMAERGVVLVRVLLGSAGVDVPSTPPGMKIILNERQLVAGLAVWEADAPRIASLTGFDWITCIPLNAN
jgi:hypothetical protein